MSNNPKLPAIPDLSQEQLNRLLCADYLENLARLVRKGTVNGLDLAWDDRYQKPVGKVALDSSALQSPLEIQLLRDIQEAQEAAARAIPVLDMTQEHEAHEKCDNSACMACNNPNKA